MTPPAEGAPRRDDQLRHDVTAHVQAIFLTLLAELGTRAACPPRGFRDHPRTSHQRMAQGISLADFLQAFWIGQLTP